MPTTELYILAPAGVKYGFTQSGPNGADVILSISAQWAMIGLGLYNYLLKKVNFLLHQLACTSLPCLQCIARSKLKATFLSCC